ncbi:XRE family transcriptional regulator [Blastococcus sp. TF02-09]|uniref:helix-turn-helix domain-containing protein n=1 Tax=Blastococcus sp. TF02-09 TaxID=2250576 RepID=UPI000DE84C34|nr:helix-turn-helix domain-containing protein [Blastococcus sp. TF02-9]RBY76895.1 XRE family transcriptional regulator [Blastococcus sp. TF02-9]
MTPSQRDELAELLTSRRKAKGLSIRGVASVAGVDAATVLSLEQGRIEQPKAAKLRAIGGALGIPAAELYAAVGWLPGAELPAFRPYLRSKYRELPEEAVTEIEAVFDRLSRDYGLHGPRDGEDERA